MIHETYWDVPTGTGWLRFGVQTLEQDIARNRSKIRYYLQPHGINSLTNVGTASCWASITAHDATGTFSWASNTPEKVILERTVWVEHAADGTRQMQVNGGIGATGTTGLGGPTEIGERTYVVPTIPRASTSTLSPSPVEAGSPLTISITRASSSFTHTLEYAFGAATGTIATGVATTRTWTPPLSLLAQIPNATFGTLTITTITYSGSTEIGRTTRTVRLNAPESVKPIITGTTHEEATPGVEAKVGAYVRGLTRLDLGINATGVHGSDITSGRIEVAGQVIPALNGVSGPINADGVVNIVATVTDSRGRTATHTTPITVLPYTPPTVTTFTVERALSDGSPDEEGTYLRVALTAEVESLKPSTVEHNTLTYRVFVRERGATSWGTAKVTSTVAGLTFDGTILVPDDYWADQSWEVLVEVEDTFNKVSLGETIATSTVFMHWADDGIGVGKFWEQGSVDAAGQMYQNNGQPVIDQTMLDTVLLPRDTAVTTSSLANNATWNGTIPLGQAFELLRLTTTAACRVRVYSSATYRTADASRTVGVMPSGDHGLIFEGTTESGALSYVLSPAASGVNLDTAVAVAVQNLSGATRTIGVTFLWR